MTKPHNWIFDSARDGTRVRPGQSAAPAWIVCWKCPECQAEVIVIRMKNGRCKMKPPGRYFVRRRKISEDCAVQLAQSIHQS